MFPSGENLVEGVPPPLPLFCVQSPERIGVSLGLRLREGALGRLKDKARRSRRACFTSTDLLYRLCQDALAHAL
jgi:hypothetical protein